MGPEFFMFCKSTTLHAALKNFQVGTTRNAFLLVLIIRNPLKSLWRGNVIKSIKRGPRLRYYSFSNNMGFFDDMRIPRNRTRFWYL